MSNNLWEEAEKFLSKDKYIGPLIKKYGPCSIRKRPKEEYFIDLVESIVSQQLSVKAASTIFERLSTRFKGKITPESVLRVRNETLRACGLSNAKVEYTKDLARRVKEKVLEIEKLDKLSEEEVKRELIAVKGIGNWTAEMFLMFTLAKKDIFPVDDLGIRNGMEKLIGKELDTDGMAKFVERWAPYRTVASWYVWAILDNK